MEPLDDDDQAETLSQQVRRFERMVRQHERAFFDLDVLEQIVEHYLDRGRRDEALEACQYGLEQYPYSLELKLNSAQVLANLQRYDEALALLDKTAASHPADLDVLYAYGCLLYTSPSPRD